MKGFFQKKKWLTAALVGALALAVYLNYYLGTDPNLSVGARPEDSSESEEETEMLGEATFVGGQPSPSKPTEVTPETGQTAMDQARKNRAAAREEALAVLQEVLDSAAAGAQDKAEAAEKAELIAENMLKESRMEGLIAAKGLGDSVVYLDAGGCSVVLSAAELSSQESTQILEMAVVQGGVSPDRVQIVTSHA